MILGARNVGGFKTKSQNSDSSYFKNNKKRYILNELFMVPNSGFPLFRTDKIP